MSAPPVRPRADVALMAGYHSPQVDVEVRLNTNESPEPPPPAFTEALAASVSGIDWHRYPDRDASELRGRIAALHGVSPSEVFCASGSNEVLQSVLLAYGGAGRRALVWEPTYALHSHLARVVGTEVIVAERGPDFEVGPEAAVAALDAARPDVVFVCSPNNPTGTVEPPQTARAVADWAAANGALVVVDEAYGQFSPTTALDLVDDSRPLVVSRTFSKTWSLAALRLGYLVGPAWVVDELHKVALPYRLDAVQQLAGVLALDHVAEMEARVARVVGERGRLEQALGGLDVDVWPSGANFVLFRPRSPSGTASSGIAGSMGDTARGDAVWQGLVDRSVLVRNCSGWPRLSGCLRVTIGTPAENDRFVAALTEVLAAG